MAKKLALCLLCLGVLAACSSTSQTVQQDPIFEENYIVRDKSGQQVGYAVKVSDYEYRLFTDDGQTVILKDPIFEDNFLIFDQRKEVK